MIDDGIRAFIRTSIKSVRALELLRLMRRHPRRTWRAEEPVRELRGSALIVDGILATFRATGLASADADGGYRYAPAGTELDRLAGQLESAYAERPAAVVGIIVTSANEKLRTAPERPG